MKWWTNLVDAIGLGESHFNTMVNRRAENIKLIDRSGKLIKEFANEKEEATFWSSEEGQAIITKGTIDKYESKS